MSDAFQRKLETNINRLIESYKTLIKKSAIESSHAPHESLVIAAAAATIVSRLKDTGTKEILYVADNLAIYQIRFTTPILYWIK